MRRIGLAVSFALAPLIARASATRAYRHYIRIVRAGFRRVVALGVIISMTLPGCASSPYYVVPDLRDRANRIASIAAVPVDVSVFRKGLRDEQFSGEWSETARTHVRNAIAKYFGSDPRFAVKEFNPKEVEAAQQELEQVRNGMEDIFPARIDQGVACLPGPVLALADAETLLLAYGRDRITTAGARAVIVLVLLALPLIVLLALLTANPFFFGATDPPMLALVQSPQTKRAPVGLRLAGRDTITLCLVDARRGDTLWFDLEAIGTGDLRDASHVERLIRDAYSKFTKAMQ